MQTSGHEFNVIMICGGLRQNILYMKLHADITGTSTCDVVPSKTMLECPTVPLRLSIAQLFNQANINVFIHNN